VGYHVLMARGAGDIGPVWPVFIATAVFMYLWWLAALLFDLVFVWHLYIRNNRLLERMDAILGGRRGGETTGKAPGSVHGGIHAPQVQR